MNKYFAIIFAGLHSAMKTNLLHFSYSLEDIEQAVKQFWKALDTYHVFAFSGDLGAGKTTFIHKLCDHLHVEDAVSSPTFALINEYHFTNDKGQDKAIYHMDWYRLRNSAEAINTGMEDCIVAAKNGDAYCFIEWPEKAKELLPHPYLWVSLESKNPTERMLSAELNSR